MTSHTPNFENFRKLFSKKKQKFRYKKTQTFKNQYFCNEPSHWLKFGYHGYLSNKLSHWLKKQNGYSKWPPEKPTSHFFLSTAVETFRKFSPFFEGTVEENTLFFEKNHSFVDRFRPVSKVLSTIFYTRNPLDYTTCI